MEISRHITSVNHPLVKHLVKLRQNSSYRQEQQSVVIEGIKPVAEICLQHSPKLILAYDNHLLPNGIRGGELILVNEAVMSKVSGMVSPEGLLAEVPIPQENSLDKMHFIVALDSVSDPGNMGTILRSALALGWQGAFILGNSCDPFNEKVIRATRGACFRLPFRHGSWEELEALIKKNCLSPFVADLEGVPPERISVAQGVLLVLSNEAKGPSQRALELCSKVTIPISADMESLNVASAGAILMYVIKNRGKIYST
ncbi:MAG: RNA methyltransferase [Parachlamydiaceae bacterium]|nr:RNA methyltransferase [Parachlamydiaceae bacterium]